MTTEEKAKAYDEALERARKLKENPKAIFFEEENIPITDYIFPELAGSEDGKIRKELINFIQSFIECHDKPDAERDEQYVSWIDWLEKQGEQKPSQRMIAGAAKEALFDYANADIPQKDFAEKQNPIEWSEEDKKMLENTIYLVENSMCELTKKEAIEWLKALKPWYK